MRNSIEITKGCLGYFLTVNGFHIKRGFDGKIIARHSEYPANNWIASEWDSIASLRKFWNDYRLIILHKTT